MYKSKRKVKRNQTLTSGTVMIIPSTRRRFIFLSSSCRRELLGDRTTDSDTDSYRRSHILTEEDETSLSSLTEFSSSSSYLPLVAHKGAFSFTSYLETVSLNTCVRKKAVYTI